MEPDTAFYVDHCPHGYSAVVMRGEAMHVETGSYPYPVVPCDRRTLDPSMRMQQTAVTPHGEDPT